MAMGRKTKDAIGGLGASVSKRVRERISSESQNLNLSGVLYGPECMQGMTEQEALTGDRRMGSRAAGSAGR